MMDGKKLCSAAVPSLRCSVIKKEIMKQQQKQVKRSVRKEWIDDTIVVKIREIRCAVCDKKVPSTHGLLLHCDRQHNLRFSSGTPVIVDAKDESVSNESQLLANMSMLLRAADECPRIREPQEKDSDCSSSSEESSSSDDDSDDDHDRFKSDEKKEDSPDAAYRKDKDHVINQLYKQGKRWERKLNDKLEEENKKTVKENENVWRCTLCLKEFPDDTDKTKSYLKSTHVLEHEQRLYQHCPHCDMPFKFEHQLSLHCEDYRVPVITPDLPPSIAEDVLYPSYVCPDSKCPATFHSRKCLLFHRSKIHDQWHRCETCEKPFLTYSELRKHVERNHNSYKREVPCPIPTCNRTFATARAVKLHASFGHPNEKEQILSVLDRRTHICELKSKVETPDLMDNLSSPPVHTTFWSRAAEAEQLKKEKQKKQRPGPPRKTSVDSDLGQRHSGQLIPYVAKEAPRKKISSGINYAINQLRKPKVNTSTRSPIVKSGFRDRRWLSLGGGKGMWLKMCILCREGFKTEEDRTSHYQETHHLDTSLEKPFECPECGDSFSSCSYKLHVYKQHPELFPKSFKHSQERKQKQSSPALFKKQASPAIFKNKCYMCQKTYESTEEKEAHYRIHNIDPTLERPYQCPACDKWLTAHWFIRHLRREHSEEVENELRKKSRAEFNRGMGLADEESDLNSDYLSDTRVGKMKRKLLIQFRCCLCQKSLGSTKEREAHYKVHNIDSTLERPYQCPAPDCDKWLTAHWFIRHLRSDHSEQLESEVRKKSRAEFSRGMGLAVEESDSDSDSLSDTSLYIKKRVPMSSPKCCLCQIRPRTTKESEVHFKVHNIDSTLERPYQCPAPDCDKWLTAHWFIRHLREHSEQLESEVRKKSRAEFNRDKGLYFEDDEESNSNSDCLTDSSFDSPPSSPKVSSSAAFENQQKIASVPSKIQRKYSYARDSNGRRYRVHEATDADATPEVKSGMTQHDNGDADKNSETSESGSEIENPEFAVSTTKETTSRPWRGRGARRGQTRRFYSGRRYKKSTFNWSKVSRPTITVGRGRGRPRGGVKWGEIKFGNREERAKVTQILALEQFRCGDKFRCPECRWVHGEEGKTYASVMNVHRHMLGMHPNSSILQSPDNAKVEIVHGKNRKCAEYSQDSVDHSDAEDEDPSPPTLVRAVGHNDLHPSTSAKGVNFKDDPGREVTASDVLVESSQVESEEESPNEEVDNEEYTKDSVIKKFKCCFCGLLYKYKWNLERHLRGKHRHLITAKRNLKLVKNVNVVAPTPVRCYKRKLSKEISDIYTQPKTPRVSLPEGVPESPRIGRARRRSHVPTQYKEDSSDEEETFHVAKPLPAAPAIVSKRPWVPPPVPSSSDPETKKTKFQCTLCPKSFEYSKQLAGHHTWHVRTSSNNHQITTNSPPAKQSTPDEGDEEGAMTESEDDEDDEVPPPSDHLEEYSIMMKQKEERAMERVSLQPPTPQPVTNPCENDNEGTLQQQPIEKTPAESSVLQTPSPSEDNQSPKHESSASNNSECKSEKLDEGVDAETSHECTFCKTVLKDRSSLLRHVVARHSNRCKDEDQT